MKKRIAVFSSGWSRDYLVEITEGVREVAEEMNADIFVFVNHSAYSESASNNTGESNIFRLPDLDDFDGVILLANSFNLKWEREYLYQEIMRMKIPAVCTEYELEDVPSIITDTYTGMYRLAKHVLEEHNAKSIMYVGGIETHPDTKERLRAVQDAALEYGILIREDVTLYAEFSKEIAYMVLERWLSENNELPDAIMCANDMMAMGVCEILTEKGYRIPEDVIVTGYDCIWLGRTDRLSLSTVKHNWNEMGRIAMDLLRKQINGEQTEKKIVMEGQLVLDESCGCTGDTNSFIRRKELIPDYLANDSHFRHVFLWIRKVTDKQMLSKNMSFIFRGEHWLEGENFKLCLEPEFFNIEEDDMNLNTEGYSEELDLLCNLKDGKPCEYQKIDKKQAIFQCADEREETGMYVYVPLYSDKGKCYGFAMLTSNMEMVVQNYLYIWTRHMMQDLEYIRNNINVDTLTRQLMELSVTDMLTKVYNRAGCEKILYPMIHRETGEGNKCALMMVDVDRLKQINDICGHDAGDQAICTVASVLASYLPPDWVTVRFGGDEFLAGGVCEDEKQVIGIVNHVEDMIQKEAERKKISFMLTASIGYDVLMPDEEIDIEESLKRADKHMYVTKEKHHKKDCRI